MQEQQQLFGLSSITGNYGPTAAMLVGQRFQAGRRSMQFHIQSYSSVSLVHSAAPQRLLIAVDSRPENIAPSRLPS